MVHKVGVSASTGILLAMQILRPLARLAEPETLEVEPSDLGLNKASSWFCGNMFLRSTDEN